MNGILAQTSATTAQVLLPAQSDPLSGLVPFALPAAILAFILAVGEALLSSRRRRKLWPESFDHLTQHPRPPAWCIMLVGALALISIAPVFTAPMAASPALRAALLALACGTIGQRSGILAFNELALLMICGGFIVLGIVIMGGDFGATALAVGVASLHMLILAVYWSRQLHRGTAWTTAGRLAPSARALSVIGATYIAWECWVAWLMRGWSWAPKNYTSINADVGQIRLELRTLAFSFLAATFSVLTALLLLFVVDFVRNRRVASILGLGFCATAIACLYRAVA